MITNEWIVKIIEMFFSISLFVNAALFIPQIIKLYKNKYSKDISLLTFAGFNLIQIFVILHAYLHKDNMLLFGFLLSFITCGCVTILTIIYRLK